MFVGHGLIFMGARVRNPWGHAWRSTTRNSSDCRQKSAATSSRTAAGVQPTGKKVWRMQYRLGGRSAKKERVTLGEYPAHTLAQARLRREQCRALIAQGQSPAAAKQAEKAVREGRATDTAFANLWYADVVSRTNIEPRNISPDYHLLNNVTLRLEDGTTQIDHILVARFGVFVIETKDYRGWIFANAQHATWTQVLFRTKFRFQNLRHVRAVQARLDFLPPASIQSAVVFTGDAEFKTPVPAGVFSLRGFVSHLREQTTELRSENRVQFSVGRLETARLAITRQTDVEHVRDLQRRHGL